MKTIGTAIIALILLHVGLVLLVFFYFNSQPTSEISDLVRRTGMVQIAGTIIVLNAIFLWVVTLVLAMRNPQLTINKKLLWVGVIIVLNFLGAAPYCFTFPKKNSQKSISRFR